MFGWCEGSFDSVRKRARVYMCTENPGQCRVCLSLNLWISFSFGHSAHRFDNVIPGSKILGSTKAQQQEV